jgi:hypothetical protein
MDTYAPLIRAGALHVFGVGLVVTLPWWLALAASATVYAVLALAALERVSWTMRGAVFIALSSVHAALTALIGALFMLMGTGNYLEALSPAGLSFLPVPLVRSSVLRWRFFRSAPSWLESPIR